MNIRTVPQDGLSVTESPSLPTTARGFAVKIDPAVNHLGDFVSALSILADGIQDDDVARAVNAIAGALHREVEEIADLRDAVTDAARLDQAA